MCTTRSNPVKSSQQNWQLVLQLAEHRKATASQYSFTVWAARRWHPCFSARPSTPTEGEPMPVALAMQERQHCLAGSEHQSAGREAATASHAPNLQAIGAGLQRAAVRLLSLLRLPTDGVLGFRV